MVDEIKILSVKGNIFASVDLFFPLSLKWRWHIQQLSALIMQIRSSSSANLPLTYIKSMSLSDRGAWSSFASTTAKCSFPAADSSCRTTLCLWQTHFIWRLPFSLNMNPEPIFLGYGWRLIQIGLDKRWCISQDNGVSSLYFSLSRYRLYELQGSLMMEYWRRLVCRRKWPLERHRGLTHKQRHT